MKLQIFFGGHHKTGLFCGVLKVKVQNWNIFGGLLNFKYFWGYV